MIDRKCKLVLITENVTGQQIDRWEGDTLYSLKIQMQYATIEMQRMFAINKQQPTTFRVVIR